MYVQTTFSVVVVCRGREDGDDGRKPYRDVLKGNIDEEEGSSRGRERDKRERELERETLCMYRVNIVIDIYSLYYI